MKEEWIGWEIRTSGWGIWYKKKSGCESEKKCWNALGIWKEWMQEGWLREYILVRWKRDQAWVERRVSEYETERGVSIGEGSEMHKDSDAWWRLCMKHPDDIGGAAC